MDLKSIIKSTAQTTEEYIAEYENEYDFRNIISPKQILKSDYPFRQITPYRQVFSDRMAFQLDEKAHCYTRFANETAEGINQKGIWLFVPSL